MTFSELKLPGVWLVEPDVIRDERGAFIRAWIPDELEAHGLETHVAQCTISQNHRRGTVRGMHYQTPPFGEAKFIRVISGGIFDVAVDLRPSSPTFRQWVGIELTAENRRGFYLPPGVAHGYQTLTDGAELLYLVSQRYSPNNQAGVRWNDPAFGIEWPLGTPSIINERDASYPNFDVCD